MQSATCAHATFVCVYISHRRLDRSSSNLLFTHVFMIAPEVIATFTLTLPLATIAGEVTVKFSPEVLATIDDLFVLITHLALNSCFTLIGP